MYSSLSIKNFRGIESLQLDKLQSINLLVGKNNVGKSTVLEAAFLLSGVGRPEVLLSLGYARGQVFQGNDETWRALFMEMDPAISIEIDGQANRKRRHLKIEGLPPEGWQANPAGASNSGQNQLRSGTVGIAVPISAVAMGSITTLPDDFAIGKLQITQLATDGREIKTVIMRDSASGSMTVLPPPGLPAEILPCVLIPGGAWPTHLELVMEISSLAEKKGEESLIESLKFVDPRISRIEVLSKGTLPTIHLDVGLKKLLPLAVAGAGTVRLFTIATKLVVVRDGLLLIDEVDNGLHHTVMDKLWDFLAVQAKRLNVQVIVTTHNDEMIQSAARCLRVRGMPMGLFRVDVADDGKHRVTSYDAEAIESVLESNFEVRS